MKVDYDPSKDVYRFGLSKVKRNHPFPLLARSASRTDKTLIPLEPSSELDDLSNLSRVALYKHNTGEGFEPVVVCLRVDAYTEVGSSTEPAATIVRYKESAHITKTRMKFERFDGWGSSGNWKLEVVINRAAYESIKSSKKKFKIKAQERVDNKIFEHDLEFLLE